MASKKPIVITAGEIRQAQSGDIITDGDGNKLATIWSGTTLPAAGLGNDGDLYYRTNIGDIFVKTGGAWVFPGGNAWTLQGVAISSTVPTTGQLLAFNGTAWAPATVLGGGGTSTSSPSPFILPPFL
jgi:hypothetical protein